MANHPCSKVGSGSAGLNDEAKTIFPGTLQPWGGTLAEYTVKKG